MCLNPIIAKYRYNSKYLYSDKMKAVEPQCNLRKVAKENGLTGRNAFKYFQELQNKFIIPGQEHLIELPCRHCPECTIQRAHMWTVRLQAEAKKYNYEGIFLTLTYNNEGLYYNNKGIAELHHKDIQNFLKRLRIKFKERKIKYYEAGEYGPKTIRPHYHMLIFGITIEDIKGNYYANTESGKMYQSNIIDKLWYREDKNKNLGFAVAEPLDNDYAIRSCAGYVNKKYYKFKQLPIKPEYNESSNGFGIELKEEYRKAVFNNSYLTINIGGKVEKIRKLDYLDRLLIKENDREFIMLKNEKVSNMEVLERYRYLDTELNLEEYLKNKESVMRDKIKERKEL